MLSGPLPPARAGMLFAREERDLVNNKQDLIEALEKELSSIREEKAHLSMREGVIVKTLSAYTGTQIPLIRATREMNTVDMARTVIRNAGLA